MTSSTPRASRKRPSTPPVQASTAAPAAPHAIDADDADDVRPSPDASPRERILATAATLFYRDGIRATGIDRVIAESGVAKVTFYRQFASKDDLVLAFLERRHVRWMAWFAAALARHGGGVSGVVPALAEWFSRAGYRGCAFINSVGELGVVLPEIVERTRRHKCDLADAIAATLPRAPGRARLAAAIALAVDGAIVQAQFMASPRPALAALRLIVAALAPSATDPPAR